MSKATNEGGGFMNRHNNSIPDNFGYSNSRRSSLLSLAKEKIGGLDLVVEENQGSAAASV